MSTRGRFIRMCSDSSRRRTPRRASQPLELRLEQKQECTLRQARRMRKGLNQVPPRRNHRQRQPESLPQLLKLYPTPLLQVPVHLHLSKPLKTLRALPPPERRFVWMHARLFRASRLLRQLLWLSSFRVQGLL